MNQTVEQRALKWLLSGDTGISSETLCGHMLGIDVKRSGPPSDSSDRGRCIRLLNLIPEWWDRLDELKSNKEGMTFEMSVDGRIGFEKNSWFKQIPLIREEAER